MMPIVTASVARVSSAPTVMYRTFVYPASCAGTLRCLLIDDRGRWDHLPRQLDRCEITLSRRESVCYYAASCHGSALEPVVSTRCLRRTPDCDLYAPFPRRIPCGSR